MLKIRGILMLVGNLLDELKKNKFLLLCNLLGNIVLICRRKFCLVIYY